MKDNWISLLWWHFSDETYTYSFGKEIERQKFDLKSGKAWRITYVNEDFR